MDFEQFTLARDLFYLAALFLGAGAGCVLNRWRRNSTFRSRNASVSAGLCFFSGTVAALTAASIFSNWAIFGETSLYLPLGIAAAILTLAFRFPRAAGFPFLLAAGVIVVLNGYFYLTFPVISRPGVEARGETPPSPEYDALIPASGLAHIHTDEFGRLRIRLLSSRGAKGGISLSVEPAEDDFLEFHAVRGGYAKNFPLVGGINLGLVTEIRDNDELLYAASRRDGIFGIFFLSFEETSGKLETAELVPGADLFLVFEGSSLAFR